MSPTVNTEMREPLTFANAPTVTRDGRQFVEHEAGLALIRRIAHQDASLLERLAQE
ncbi:hypothetical protein [Microbacterium enclense]|uniref:hypothetical protein n=1 Tax=Microbacterium enclense TaxID=993073 RepID=UPI003F80E002